MLSRFAATLASRMSLTFDLDPSLSIWSRETWITSPLSFFDGFFRRRRAICVSPWLRSKKSSCNRRCYSVGKSIEAENSFLPSSVETRSRAHSMIWTAGITSSTESRGSPLRSRGSYFKHALRMTRSKRKEMRETIMRNQSA